MTCSLLLYEQKSGKQMGGRQIYSHDCPYIWRTHNMSKEAAAQRSDLQI